MKKMISWLLALSLLCSAGVKEGIDAVLGFAGQAVISNAIAEKTEEKSGSCGTNVTWTLTHDGILTISGEGAITNSSYCNQGIEIKEVIIQDNITSICSSAFDNCGNLEKITLPETLTAIEGSAFSGCSNLTRIDLPDNVTSLRTDNYYYSYAFYNYDGLIYCDPTSVTARTVSNTNHDFYVGEDTSFGLRYISSGGSQKLALYTYTGNDAVVEIPAYVEHITDYAFYKSEIEELILPDSLVSISNTALNNTKNSLRRIVFSDGLAEIPSGMFSGFNQLEEIVFQEGITGIASNAIINCPKLSSVTIPITMSAIDASNFRNCPSLQLSVYPGSFAESWAEEYAIPFSYVSQNALIVRADEEQAEQYSGLYLVLSTDGNETVRVMDGSLKYIFYGVTEMNSHQLYIKNQYGHLVSRTLNITAEPDKTECAIPSLLSLADVHLTIRDEAMNNVSDSADIVWTDDSGEQIASGQTLGSIPVGEKLTAQITLRGQAALEYKQPDPLTLTVNESSKAKSVYLQRAQGGSGAFITLNGIYKAADQDNYCFSKWDKVAFDIENVTTGDSHLAYVVDNGQLFLGNQANDGDNLHITLSAKDGDFLPVSVNVQLASGAAADFRLVQKGVLSASFESETPVTMLVYNAQDTLAWSGDSDQGEITTIGLDEGLYSVILMDAERCETRPEQYSAFQRMGLTEGVDYVSRSMRNSENTVACASFGTVPSSDNTCGYLNSLTFAINSRQLSVGKYFTLKANAVLKESFSETIMDAYWLIELPSQCAFSADTISVGRSIVDNYRVENGNIVVPVSNPADIFRICLIPLSSTSMEIRGSFNFTENGQQVTRQVEPLTIQAEGLKINVLEKTNSTTNHASGTISGTATVKLYDGSVLVGETKTDGAGAWNLEFELVKPYTYTNHIIWAEFVTAYGNVQSDPVQLLYQYVENPIRVQSVYLRTGNNSVNLQIPMVNGHLGEGEAHNDSDIPIYSFNFTNPEISFDVVFDGSTLDNIKSVHVKIGLSNGKSLDMRAVKSSETTWTCASNFQSSALPSSIQVNFISTDEIIVSSDQIQELLDQQEIEEPDDEEKIDYMEYLVLSDNDDPLVEEINSLIDEYNASIDDIVKAQERLTRSIDSFYGSFYSGNGRFSDPNDSSIFVEITTKKLNSGYLTSHGYSNVQATGNITVYTSETDSNYTDCICSYIPEYETFIVRPWIEISLYSMASDEPIRIMSRSAGNSADTSDFSNSDMPFAIKHWNGIELGVNVVGTALTICEKKAEKIFESCKKLANDITTKQINISNKIKEQDRIIATQEKLKEIYKNDKGVIDRCNERIFKATQRKEAYTNTANQLAKDLKAANAAGTKAAIVFKVVKGGAEGLAPVLDTLDIFGFHLGNFEKEGYLEKRGYLKSLLDNNPDNQEIKKAIRNTDSYITGKVVSFALGAVGVATTVALACGAIATAPAWATPVAIASLGLAIGDFVMSPKYDKMYEGIKEKYGNTGSGYTVDALGKVSGIIDPSGFVYEAVLSNRLEGVEATVWQKETKYDMYDEPYEEISQWDAVPYDQVNPQITQEDGIYAWDVPDGLWQVRLWKNGYEEAQSDWMTVPPPHFNVNIGMVNREKPEVASVAVTKNAITIEFDKYVDINTVNGNVRLYCGQVNTSFVLSFPDAEASANDPAQSLAKTAVLTLASPLEVGTSIELTVAGQVRSYAGTLMENDYTYQGTIKALQSLKANSVTLEKGKETYISIVAEPAEAAQGMTVTVTGDLAALGLEEGISVQLNSFGRGSLAVRGTAPGTYNLLLSLEETEITAEVTVTVPVNQFSFQQNSIALAVGIGFADEAVLLISDDSIDNSILTWETSDPSVVTVNGGVIKAIGEGTAAVTASANGVSASCTVQVYGDLMGLSMPSVLREIEDEAFMNCSFQYVTIPSKVISIGDGAFAGNSALMFVYIPASVTEFGENVFDDSVIVYCEDDSAAEDYCQQNGIQFVTMR